MKRNSNLTGSTKEIPKKDKYGKTIIPPQKPTTTTNRASSNARKPSVPRIATKPPATANNIITKRPTLVPENESTATKPPKKAILSKKPDNNSYRDDNMDFNQKQEKIDNNLFSEKKEESSNRNTIVNKEEAARSNMSR